MYLQSPISDFRNVPYHNPQCLDLHDMMDPEESVLELDQTQPANSGEDLESTSKDFSYVIDHLPPPNYLTESLVDERIITPLHSYQRVAVNFASKREAKTLPSEMTLWKRHSPQNTLP